jgi:hypothetical protein
VVVLGLVVLGVVVLGMVVLGVVAVPCNRQTSCRTVQPGLRIVSENPCPAPHPAQMRDGTIQTCCFPCHLAPYPCHRRGKGSPAASARTVRFPAWIANADEFARTHRPPYPLIRRFCSLMTARKTPGKALVGRIIADMGARGLEPDAKETELLRLAEGLADQLEALRQSVAAEGYCSTLESGRIVANPAAALINTTSLALAKVLAQVQMGDQPPVDLVKQRASKARWRQHNLAKAAGGD